ncbi:hypothetical protein GOP47_0016865 [Adiantum capillus-veneris]|uniref:Uncharacterized protein n=1 Tax=Adiantum capillus-veneris TaxID=13818 RepID=A0A9D4UIL3_ADICA|nr:hypothetical protein GOP47_0016865 [Adiantum capillus-veneris]
MSHKSSSLPEGPLILAQPVSLEAGQLNEASAESAKMLRNVRDQFDELESKSVSSDNQDGASADEQDGHRRGKKRYHRHTQRQIHEMERLFKECPHPDEKARLELSRELNLDPRQVKFWFQNKRTQMKAQQERHDNSYLRNENDKLKAENAALREAVRSVVCSKCGGPAANMQETTQDDQQIRLENAKLKEEVSRLTILAANRTCAPPVAAGGVSAPVAAPPPAAAASPPVSSTELGLNNIQAPIALSELAAAGPSVAEIATRPLCLTDSEKRMVVELAVSAMEELAQVAQAGEPLWVPAPSVTTCEILDDQKYLQRFPRVIGPTPLGLKVEATRETDLVYIDGSSLVETLMDVVRWADMFPAIICKAQTVEVLSTGVADPYDGAMQVIYTELQLPSPLVATREMYYLRYAKKVDHLWVVVDVAVDGLRGNPPPSLLRCRKRPSGCVIEDTNNGYSKVTWVEHVEVDDKGVHPSYQTLVSSGLAFGAQRWVATLQRQCERVATLLIPNGVASKNPLLPNSEGRKSLLKLAERMSNNFCAGVSASSNHTWITLSGTGGVSDECHVVIRKSVDDPGRPPGIVLSAATSFWLPVPPSRVFEFLRDERYRIEWDILSNMGVVEEIVHVPKGQDSGNCVSLLKVNAINSNQSNMLILQDCCTDKSCSLVIYAPVDVGAMGAVLNGSDPDVVLLLPSGFAILPDGNPLAPSPLLNKLSSKNNNHISTSDTCSGSLLTVAFQILVDHVPTAKLSLESVATVNNLISSTVVRIKGALSCDNLS